MQWLMQWAPRRCVTCAGNVLWRLLQPVYVNMFVDRGSKEQLFFSDGDVRTGNNYGTYPTEHLDLRRSIVYVEYSIWKLKVLERYSNAFRYF